MYETWVLRLWAQVVLGAHAEVRKRYNVCNLAAMSFRNDSALGLVFD